MTQCRPIGSEHKKNRYNQRFFNGASWDEEQEKYYFSVIDVIAVLTDSDYQTARNYWKVLKHRLQNEGASQTVTNCNQLKMMASDGKMRNTDVADTEELLRIIQSIPFPQS